MKRKQNMSIELLTWTRGYWDITWEEIVGCVWFAKKWRTGQNNFSCPVFDL